VEDVSFAGIELINHDEKHIDLNCSVFLGNIKSAYENNPTLENLLLDQFFTEAINKCQLGWRKVIAAATVYGIPIPCLSTGMFLC
jgi:6-phosphogluconate dehydrogenase